MAARRVTEIAGIPVVPGERTEGAIRVGTRTSGGAVEIPVRVIAGKKPGPVVWLQACIHGDEYDGTVAVARVAEMVTPEELAGALVAIPVLNVSAFESRRRTSPVDDVDMNRVFPGKAEGTYTEQVAHTLWETMRGKIDYFIDLHGGGNIFQVAFYAIYREAANAASEQAQVMAVATGAPVVKRDNEARLVNTSFAQLTKAGVPAVIIESGGGGQIEQTAVNDHVTAILGILRSLGLISGRSEENPIPRYVTTTLHATVGHGGLAWPLRSLFEEVAEGEPVAEIRDMFGRRSFLLRAPFRGIVLALRTNPAVNSGDPAVVIGKLED